MNRAVPISIRPSRPVDRLAPDVVHVPLRGFGRVRDGDVDVIAEERFRRGWRRPQVRRPLLRLRSPAGAWRRGIRIEGIRRRFGHPGSWGDGPLPRERHGAAGKATASRSPPPVREPPPESPPHNASGSALQTPLRSAGPRPSCGTCCPRRRPATCRVAGNALDARSRKSPGRAEARGPLPAGSTWSGAECTPPVTRSRTLLRAGAAPPRPGGTPRLHNAQGQPRRRNGRSELRVDSGSSPPSPPLLVGLPRDLAPVPQQRPSRVSRSSREDSSGTSSPKTSGTGYSSDCTALVRSTDPSATRCPADRL